MTDREKVISGLMHHREKCSINGDICPYLIDQDECVRKLCDDVLELLKEQEAKEQYLKTKCVICPHCEHCDVDENGLLKEQPEIVRCRNCRHYNTEFCSDGYGWCHRRDFGTNDEWYCADGERRDKE